MKKIQIVTLSALLVSSVVLGGAVSAAELGGKYGTNGIITFKQNDEPTNPVDPTDPGLPVLPENPTDPGNPITPGTPGPLSIDYASSFNFEEQKITSKDEVYNAAPQMVKDTAESVARPVPSYVQVSDTRGEYSGWALGVKQNGQFKIGDKPEEPGTPEDAATDILAGAQITINNGVAVNEKESNATAPSTVNGTIVLDPEGKASQPVMAAKADEGQGTWVYSMGDATTMANSVTLEVPGKAIKKEAKYTTSLTWELSTTPGAGEE